jgi:hypothetical protein
MGSEMRILVFFVLSRLMTHVRISIAVFVFIQLFLTAFHAQQSITPWTQYNVTVFNIPTGPQWVTYTASNPPLGILQFRVWGAGGAASGNTPGGSGVYIRTNVTYVASIFFFSFVYPVITYSFFFFFRAKEMC